MKLSAEQQLELFEKHKKLAPLALVGYLHRHSDRIIDLARERGFGIGLHEYGDASWHLPRAAVKRGIDEELADAIFYNVILKAIDGGDL